MNAPAASTSVSVIRESSATDAAFTGLSSLENASLAVVAPGIAEALVATAIGLFAAIPAVAAYNYYNNRVGRLSNRVDGFSEEFLNILERQSR